MNSKTKSFGWNLKIKILGERFTYDEIQGENPWGKTLLRMEFKDKNILGKESS